MVIFESEDAAKQASERSQQNMPIPVTLDGVEIREVAAPRLSSPAVTEALECSKFAPHSTELGVRARRLNGPVAGHLSEPARILSRILQPRYCKKARSRGPSAFS